MFANSAPENICVLRLSAIGDTCHALAVIRNRNYVLPQDVFDVAPEVMRHRLVLSYEALARDISPDHVVAGILATVPAPRVAPSQEPTYGTHAAG